MEENPYIRIEEDVTKLIEKISARMTSEEIRRIRAAYEFAREAHKKQMRKSGEPYIVHPVSVACIVAEDLEMDANTIIAAFLHDVAEDTDYSIGDIRERFGDDVAYLVGVVTKTKKKEYINSLQIDNYHQILKSVEYDIRALLIKFADRLNNMRTLGSMATEKKMKICAETSMFYAPLANRLGLFDIKSELEDLAYRYSSENGYANIEKKIKNEKEKVQKHINEFTDKIDEALKDCGIPYRLEVRHRTAHSILRKMSERKCSFEHVEGKHYLRIIYNCPEEEEKTASLKIYSNIGDHFTERPGSVFNFINAPKANGYQSFHVQVLGDEGIWEEIHISSERMVRNSRMGCKANYSGSNIKQWLDEFKDILKDLAEDRKKTNFIDEISLSFFQEDVLVYTTDGQGILLPKGSTALDFAFANHGANGIHANYAHINKKLFSIKTELKRGDCVEIGMDNKLFPDPDWINHVHIYEAKKILGDYIDKRQKPAYTRCTHCHPIPGDEVIGIAGAKDKITVHKKDCIKANNMASQFGEKLTPVDFKESPAVLYPVRLHVRGIDRYHLLIDLVGCITEKLKLSMERLFTETVDRIAVCTIDFNVHSAQERQDAIDMIAAIEGVDEVTLEDIETNENK